MVEEIETIGPTMKVREFFTLLWVNFVVFIKNTIEFFKVAFRYYRSFSFLKADLALRLTYLFNNPYKISKRFLMKKGEDEIYAYGETPLTSLEMIAKECGLTSKDCVFELGCGRGRTCFWLHSFVGCSVVGIEYIPEFVERANQVKDRLAIPNVEFRLEDMAKADLSGATVCYLYGTCLDEKTINTLIRHFSRLPAGTKIITVSYPLSDYADTDAFEVMKRFTVPYTWGNADVFLQVIKASPKS
jgi:SAM-dependent methyltransferase